jgi:hypothetical protein
MRNDSRELRAMVRAYAECLLWQGLDWMGMADDDANPEPLDANYSVDDLAPEAWRAIEADCRAFLAANVADLAEWDAEQAGYDFCLTRNGHGTGFWDRGRGDAGERLSKAARVYGESGEYTQAGHVYV